MTASRPPEPTPPPADRWQPATAALHAGAVPDPATGAILPPIYQTTTYVQDSLGEDRGYTYSRSGNPTVTALERRLAALEGTEHCLCFATGLAATATLALALLSAGDRVVVSAVVYGGTVRLFGEVLARFGVEAEFVDTGDGAALASALERPARLVFVETPANPTLRLTDIAAAARHTHRAGALLVVDNTLLTPALQRPFELGADLVLHSTTKYIEGHNATVGGALLARDPALDEPLRYHRNALGTIQSPFAAWLTLQGVKSLPLRMERQAATARRVAEFLDREPEVRRVHYPGLASFPQRELAERQQTSGGALLSFELTGGETAARRFLSSLRLCSLAENLGAVETLVTHPATMTHAAVPAARREELGIGGDLVRLSLGLEAADDLIADLARGLGSLR